MTDSHEHADADQELSAAEILGWLEFGCWTTIVLAPFLYYVNGPAVSQDQFVVRTILVCVAVVGALSLSGRRLIHRRRANVSGEARK